MPPSLRQQFPVLLSSFEISVPLVFRPELYQIHSTFGRIRSSVSSWRKRFRTKRFSFSRARSSSLEEGSRCSMVVRSNRGPACYSTSDDSWDLLQTRHSYCKEWAKTFSWTTSCLQHHREHDNGPERRCLLLVCPWRHWQYITDQLSAG